MSFAHVKYRIPCFVDHSPQTSCICTMALSGEILSWTGCSISSIRTWERQPYWHMRCQQTLLPIMLMFMLYLWVLPFQSWFCLLMIISCLILTGQRGGSLCWKTSWRHSTVWRHKWRKVWRDSWASPEPLPFQTSARPTAWEDCFWNWRWNWWGGVQWAGFAGWILAVSWGCGGIQHCCRWAEP